MIVLYLLSLIGVFTGFILITLAIACGLYYLSELVEEHTTFTKRWLEHIILATIIVHIALVIFDGFPFWLSLFSILAQYIYRMNLANFPYIVLTGPVFIVSCLLMILNHYLWFRHFSYLSEQSLYQYDPYSTSQLPSFSQIASFFGLAVWLVPFSLFVSLTAAENVLPSVSDGSAVGQNKAHRSGLAKVFVEYLKSTFERLTGRDSTSGIL